MRLFLSGKEVGSMAQIFRVERTKNFTVMSNHHFKNKNLTLKAKGLLSLMLSLPDDWNYNMQVIAWSKDKYNLFRQQVKDSFVADYAMEVLKEKADYITKSNDEDGPAIVLKKILEK